jgi:hypothetical protein
MLRKIVHQLGSLYKEKNDFHLRLEEEGMHRHVTKELYICGLKSFLLTALNQDGQLPKQDESSKNRVDSEIRLLILCYNTNC